MNQPLLFTGKWSILRYTGCVYRVNANLDMILSARELLQALKATPSKPFDHPHLTSIAELEQLVLYSMLHCAGLERTFTDGDLFKDIVEAASSLSHTVSSGIVT